MPPRVCLITPGHIASTPRLVKEADTLAAAGYDVHVVAGRHFAPVKPFDDTLLAAAPWQYHPVEPGPRPAALLRKIVHRAARSFARRGSPSPTLAAVAQHENSLRLAAAAARLDAKLYHGHCLAGLAAAGMASERRRALLGFDAEDFHRGETSAQATAHAVALEQHWLPRCRHRTAAAPLIAQAYSDACRIPAPDVILNVFPLAEGPPKPVEAGPISAESPARLHWFSQTIGPGRGLEEMIAILGHMRVPAELHLRGFVAPDYRTHLETLAAMRRVRPLQFLPSVPPRALAALAASSHLGLSLELPFPPNHDLCLANKIFLYLLAGIPQLLSPTRGQTAIASELNEAAILIDFAHPAASASRVDALLADPNRLQRARSCAWHLARQRFCWDQEQAKFLAAVERMLPISKSR